MTKKIVVPGELLAENIESTGANVIVKDGNAYSSVLGVFYDDSKPVKVVPLAGSYTPKEGDLIIGFVEMVRYAGALLDIGTNKWAFMASADYPRGHEPRLGDAILARVSEVDEMNAANLNNASRLGSGRFLQISAAKVPRIIGTKHSMLNMLKDQSGCKVVVGLNGRVWVQGDNQNTVIEAVKLIAEKSHESGLTEKIKTFLEGELK